MEIDRSISPVLCLTRNDQILTASQEIQTRFVVIMDSPLRRNKTLILDKIQCTASV